MDAQSLELAVPAEHVDALKQRLREEFPNVLVGTKALADGSVLLAVTLYSVDPQRIEDLVDSVRFENSPAGSPSLSELVEKVRQSQA